MGSFRDHPDGLPLRQPDLHLVDVDGRDRGTTEADTVRTSTLLAADDPGRYQATFEFGEDPCHSEHGPPRGRGRIEGLLVQEEIATTGLEIAQKADQIGERASQAVNRPCGHHVDLTTADSLEECVEAGPLITSLGAGHSLVFEDLDDVPAGPLSDVEQDAALVLRRLLVGRDSEINSATLHHEKIARIGKRSRKTRLCGVTPMNTSGSVGIAAPECLELLG